MEELSSNICANNSISVTPFSINDILNRKKYAKEPTLEIALDMTKSASVNHKGKLYINNTCTIIYGLC